MTEISTYDQVMERQEGILLVDKPAGISSHTVVNWARKTFGVRKIGHTGTLDPLASGLLMLLIGRRYTKQQVAYLKLPKTYSVTAVLGAQTDTYDRTGRIISSNDIENLDEVVKQMPEEEIIETIQSFKGTSNQTVPPYSAVKRNGKKLYDLANAGVLDHTSLPEREIRISQIDDITIFKIAEQVQVRFSVSCSSGTYVRSLVHDIGQRLNVGAYVTELRRTRIGNWHVELVQICPYVPARFYFQI